jgi:AbrB family looped-hinge helix DNA binding protein
MVSIDRAGRIVIPKAIRDRLEWSAGVDLELQLDDDAVRLVAARRPSRRIVTIDGWPTIESVDGVSIGDGDVQAWRDDARR